MPARKHTRTKRRKLPRVLAEPVAVKVYRRTLVGLTADEAKKKNEAEGARVMKLLSDKLEFLFHYFSIARTGNPADEYRALSLALAVKHFPGFRLVPAGTPGPGRPTHDSLFLMGLLVDLEQKRRSMRAAGSKVSAAKVLVALTLDPRSKKRWGRYKPRTLANFLSQARNPKINPMYKLWNLKGQAGKEAREGITAFIAESRKTSS